LWSYVKKKERKKWVWVALIQRNRKIIAFHIGDRSAQSAQRLWNKLPIQYQKKAKTFTDKLRSYDSVIPDNQHIQITKYSRDTNHIERFFSTLRQRVARLARKTLSFSKSLSFHNGTIKNFICEYNLSMN